MTAEDELAELQAAFEEYKESSAAIEEDLEQEVNKLEKENVRIAHKLEVAEQAVEAATRKGEQARELASRQIMTLEKQVQAMEVSMKVMSEDRRRMEQEKDDVERVHRQLQAQCEDQCEAFENLAESEAMIRTSMEDLELRFHRATVEHMSILTKLKAAFKALYAQLKRLKQTPAVEMPGATPEEQASMDAESSAENQDRMSVVQAEETVQEELNKQLQDQLASAYAQLDQAQRRAKELELELQRERKISTSTINGDGSRSSGPVENGDEKSVTQKPITNMTEGYLHKRGDGALSTWKRQLYKINSENHTLEFFFIQSSKVTTKRIKLGDIPLTGAQICAATKDDKPNVFCIQPRFSKKTFYLQAPNSAERDGWVHSLQQESDAQAKQIADSVRQDWVELSFDQTNFEAVYCVVSKTELQLFHSESDDRAFKRYELDDTVEIQRLPKVASQRPALILKFGPVKEEMCIGFNSAEKRDTWHSLVRGLCSPQNQREESENESTHNAEEQESAEFPFCGPLALMDPNTKQWEQHWFQLSADTNFLNYYADQRSASNNSEPLGRLALVGSVHNVTSTAIVSNYPAGAFPGHEHIFGLTPPFSSSTRLIQCLSEEHLFQWMDGLVTLLDSKTARDPYSAKEGYLYKQGVKATSKWRKKYVVLGLPDLKYYKAGRQTRAVILTLTPESQVILRHPVKKFVYTFTVQEGPGTREYLWGSKSQAEGEAWVSAIQACITKLRQRQPNPTNFNLSKLRNVRPRDASKEPTNRLSKRDVSPAPASVRVRQSSDSLKKTGSLRKNAEEQQQPEAGGEAAKQPTHRKLTSYPSSSLTEPLTPPDNGTMSLPLGLGPRNSHTSGSSFNFMSQDSQGIFTARRGVLRVLKTSLFSRQERWVPMVFELQANDRVLNYYDEGSTKTVPCSVAGCTNEPFARFDGLCAHHHRTKELGRASKEETPTKKKAFIWNLVGAQIDAHISNQYPGHEFTFGLTGTGGPALVVAAQDEKERSEWLGLLRARIYARFMFKNSSHEGLLAQHVNGEWKEKYYVVRNSCLECYNRTDHKRAWSHALTKVTKVRAADLAQVTGKPSPTGLARSMSNVGRSATLRPSSGGLRPSTSFFGRNAEISSDPKLLVCENNNDRIIHPKGVLIVDLGSEKLTFGAETPSDRDLWIAALDACVKEALADDDDFVISSITTITTIGVEEDDNKRLRLPTVVSPSRRTKSLGDFSSQVQISVSSVPPPPPVEEEPEELPAHLTWWANRAAAKTSSPSSKASSPPSSVTSSPSSSFTFPPPECPPPDCPPPDYPPDSPPPPTPSSPPARPSVTNTNGPLSPAKTKGFNKPAPTKNPPPPPLRVKSLNAPT